MKYPAGTDCKFPVRTDVAAILLGMKSTSLVSRVKVLRLKIPVIRCCLISLRQLTNNSEEKLRISSNELTKTPSQS